MTASKWNLSNGKASQLSVQILAEPVPALRLSKKRSALAGISAVETPLVLLDSSGKVLSVYSSHTATDWANPPGLAPERDVSATQTEPLLAHCPPAPVLGARQPVQAAVELFEADPLLEWIPLLNKANRYTGFCVSRGRYNDWRQGALRPLRAGGMATPLGVYMTSGRYVTGAGWWGIVAAGFTFGVVTFLLEYLALILYSVLLMLVPAMSRFSTDEAMWLQLGMMGVLLAIGIRLSPISGLHAAEHMTIYAMEKGLPLTQQVVLKQPRAHPRCGTNWVAFILGLQLVLFVWSWGVFRLNAWGVWLATFFWFGITLWAWRPAGLWIQEYFTTRMPNASELQSGLQAGQELLNRYQKAPHGPPGILQRIWFSGLVPMVLSFMAGWQIIGWLADVWLQLG